MPARAVSRSDLLLALVLAALAAGLYGATLCRSIYWYDSAEYVTAAYTLGVPHPPGYPLYTLLAHAFTWLPVAPALAVNAMSALFGALAVSLCYATARVLGAGEAAAAAAALLLGSGPSFWFNSTVAEVYTPGLCFTFGVLLLLLLAQSRKDSRLAVAAAALAGTGMGVHYSIATLGLGFAWLAARPAWGLSRPNRARNVAGLFGACALAAVLAYATIFAYVLLRSRSDAVPNQAAPLSFARLLWLVSGGNYRLWFLNYEFLPRAQHVLRLIAREASPPGAALGLLGLVALALRDRGRALGLLLASAGNLAAFFCYRVDDLEVFLLPSIALLCACAGVGTQWLADRIALFTKRSRARALAPLLVLGLGLARIGIGFRDRDLSGFTAAHDYGERLTVQLPYRAVVLNYTTPDEWKYDAVFGMYFQHVLERRRDVVVFSHADRPILDRLLFENRPTYLYAPVAHVAREYALAPEGDLYRLVRRR